MGGWARRRPSRAGPCAAPGRELAALCRWSLLHMLCCAATCSAHCREPEIPPMLRVPSYTLRVTRRRCNPGGPSQTPRQRSRWAAGEGKCATCGLGLGRNSGACWLGFVPAFFRGWEGAASPAPACAPRLPTPYSTVGKGLGWEGCCLARELGWVRPGGAVLHWHAAGQTPSPAPTCRMQVAGLLSSPLERYDVVTVLGLEHYASVLRLLRPGVRREMAIKIVQASAARAAAGGGGGWGCGGAGLGQGSKVGALRCAASACLPLPAALTRAGGAQLHRALRTLATPCRAAAPRCAVLQTMLKTGVRVGSVGQVEVLFGFIAPLVEEVEGAEEELEEEVRGWGRGLRGSCGHGVGGRVGESMVAR